MDSLELYKKVVNTCRRVYCDKLQDYGISFRRFRIVSLINQMDIKVSNIVNIQNDLNTISNETIVSDIIAIYNYSMITLMKLNFDITTDNATDCYDICSDYCFELFKIKNSQYKDKWMDISFETVTDMIAVKLERCKQIISNNMNTKVSEPLESHIKDIANYSVIYLMKLNFVESKNFSH